jgi:ABC-2 type transport system permease protein
MIRLLRLQARRDRITLTIWILGIALLVTASASAVGAEYGTDEERTQILTIGLSQPAILALRGIPNGATLGSMIWFQICTFLCVMVGLMSTFLATRHGRADEERGRRELIVAAPQGRTASLRATITLGLIANVLVGLLAAGGFIAAGLDADGALAAGTAIAATGIAFLGIGMLVGELVSTSRAANGISAAVVVAAYVFRAAGDALGTPDLQNLTLEPAWISWLSPIGWAQQVFPFTENDYLPLLLTLGLAVVATAAALVLRSTRDLGSSLLPERAGRATARATLRGDLGLAWRLQWPTLLGWTAGTAVFGLIVGSLGTAVSDAAFDNPDLLRILQSLSHTSRDDIAIIFTGTIFVFVCILAAAAGIQAVLRMREEESQGRAELLLATPLGRIRWMADAILIGIVTVVIVIGVTATAAWLSFLPYDKPDLAWNAVGTALVQLPAAIVFVALAALLVGVLPSVATGVTWGAFGVSVVLGLFGGLLQLPDEVVTISPLANVPTVPVDDWGLTVVLLASALVAIVLGLVTFRRRDLTT